MAGIACVPVGEGERETATGAGIDISIDILHTRTHTHAHTHTHTHTHTHPYIYAYNTYVIDGANVTIADSSFAFCSASHAGGAAFLGRYMHVTCIIIHNDIMMRVYDIMLQLHHYTHYTIPISGGGPLMPSAVKVRARPARIFVTVRNLCCVPASVCVCVCVCACTVP